ncbi:14447_t:CDS:1, partial [Funneliformis mosseae]
NRVTILLSNSTHKVNNTGRMTTHSTMQFRIYVKLHWNRAERTANLR